MLRDYSSAPAVALESPAVEGVAMLTAEQATELRGKVETANRRRADQPFALARCCDGPLGGLDIRLEPHEARSKSIIVAWSLPTDRGAIWALYEPSDKAGELRFREYGTPGRRESGRLEDFPTG